MAGSDKKLPVYYESGDVPDAPRVMGGPAAIETPDGQAIQQYGGDGNAYNVCGTCRYFDYKNGQIQIAKERFAERMVREMGWKLKHLGVPVEQMGLCAAEGDKATTPVSRSCDQYRPKNGRIR